MKITSAFKPLILAVALASAGVASAATYSLNTLSVGDNYLSGSDESVISVGNGSFSDIFHFSLSSSSSLGAAAGVLNFSKFKITADSFAYSLYSGNLNAVSGTALATGMNDSGFVLPALSGGAYTLFVNGTATGLSGGKYNGSLTVAAVPEPESYAMFLAGLGIMGTVVRRRSAKNV